MEGFQTQFHDFYNYILQLSYIYHLDIFLLQMFFSKMLHTG